MDNPLDFLDGQAPADTTAATSETPPPAETPASDTVAPEAAAEAEPGPARDDKGRFAPKGDAAPQAPADSSPQAPATPPEAAQTSEPAKPPEGYVPVGVVQALREEIQALKRQPPPPSQPPPDPREDLAGYQAWQEEQHTASTFQWSFRLLAVERGAEQAKAVAEWARDQSVSDPHFYERALASENPATFALAEYERHQALSMLTEPGFREKFQAFLSGQAAPQPAAGVTTPPPPPNPTPPPASITSAPSAGGAQSVPTGPGAAYERVFG